MTDVLIQYKHPRAAYLFRSDGRVSRGSSNRFRAYGLMCADLVVAPRHGYILRPAKSDSAAYITEFQSPADMEPDALASWASAHADVADATGAWREITTEVAEAVSNDDYNAGA